MQQKAGAKQPGAPHIQTSGTDTEPGSGPARFTKESNAAITKLTEAITNMEAAVAASKESLTLTKTDLDETNKHLSDLHDTETDLHNSCDYLLKNFFVRQENRAAEIEALGEAKAILSGMK